MGWESERERRNRMEGRKGKDIRKGNAKHAS
jgi:hypothetical protein